MDQTRKEMNIVSVKQRRVEELMGQKADLRFVTLVSDAFARAAFFPLHFSGFKHPQLHK